VPTLGNYAFFFVPTTCTIIVPDMQYDGWTAATLPDESANPWYALVTAGYKFLKHSEWEYARKYEVVKIPVYDRSASRHVFLDATGTNAVDQAIAGFTTAGAHRWRATRKCIVYLKASHNSDTNKPRLYVHVNDANAREDDTGSMIFKQGFTKNVSVVVPIFLNAGDSLDIWLTNNLEQLQYSVFYTD